MSETQRIYRARADSISEAATILPADEALAHLFYEEREDVERRVSTGGLREERRHWTSGAAAVGRTSLHVTGPAAEDLIHLARAAADPSAELRPPIGDDGTRWATRTGDGLALEDLEEWLRAVDLPVSARVEARVVSHDQAVWVGRPGQATAFDLRRGRRLEISVHLGDTDEAGRAVSELVLRESDTLPSGLLAETIERARERVALTPATGPGWKDVTAVFAPGCAGVVVHELIGHALEGDVVHEGRSWLTRPDVTALPRMLTVVDDPRRSRAPWAIDDEGTPSAALTLVDEGRVTAIVHDRASAMRASSSSTGHGRRGSYLGRILPRLGCTYIENGVTRASSIIEDTVEGVYIRRIVGGVAVPERGSARFLVTDADRIERGRLAAPLPPFPVYIDLHRHLASLDAVGDDLWFDRCIGSCVRDGQPVATSVGAPTIRLGVIKVWT
jgi:TldD protein